MFFLPIIIFAVFFVVFIIIGLSAVKSHKQTGDTIQNMINTVSAYAKNQMQDEAELSNNQLKSETKVCEYCGSQLSAGVTKCGACGAKVNNKK